MMKAKNDYWWAVWLGILLGGFLALALATPGFSATQEALWFPGSSFTGLTKGDLTIYLDREDPTSASDFASQATTDITVTEVGSTGRYYIQGLPTVDPGDDYNFVISIEYGNKTWLVGYPPRTLSGANIVWGGLVAVPEQYRYVVGATTPDIQLTVRGLGSNPTGATVTFTATSLDGATTVISAASATVSGVTSVVDEDDGTTTYDATLTFDTTSTLTATAGNYIGRFKVTFGDGEIIFLPISRGITIEVVR